MRIGPIQETALMRERGRTIRRPTPAMIEANPHSAAGGRRPRARC